VIILTTYSIKRIEVSTALYTAFKDALIQKNGILKVYWDDSQKTTREEYHKVN
jgi:hypothetical protein